MPQTKHINIPGQSTVDLNQGDTLKIHWASACSFCIVSGSANDFNPSLPNGQSGDTPDVWEGTANVTNATITYNSPNQCGSPVATGGSGTIKIGTGFPAKK